MGILEIDLVRRAPGYLSHRDQALHGTGETPGRSICSTANEAGTCFNITTNPSAQFPVDTMISSSKKSTVTIDPHINCTTDISDIHIPLAMVGIETAGAACRTDNPDRNAKCHGILLKACLLTLKFETKINRRVDELMAREGSQRLQKKNFGSYCPNI